MTNALSVSDILRDHDARLALVEEQLWVIHSRLGVPAYDFDFDAHLNCSHPYRLPDEGVALLRVGALHHYERLYSAFAEEGLSLINNPDQYRRATDLTEWYDALQDLTPRSRWWSDPPILDEVLDEFDWPVFIKGERQTNRHDASSVVRSRREFESFMDRWLEDPVLSWQRVVVREFVELRRVAGATGEKVPASFEFRTFWWRGELLGAGPYWDDFAEYTWGASERDAGLAIGREAASRVDVDFLVVDIAQKADGEWIVIELNEGQESGYAGVPGLPLWRKLLSQP